MWAGYSSQAVVNRLQCELCSDVVVDEIRLGDKRCTLRLKKAASSKWMQGEIVPSGLIGAYSFTDCWFKPQFCGRGFHLGASVAVFMGNVLILRALGDNFFYIDPALK